MDVKDLKNRFKGFDRILTPKKVLELNKKFLNKYFKEKKGLNLKDFLEKYKIDKDLFDDYIEKTQIDLSKVDSKFLNAFFNMLKRKPLYKIKKDEKGKKIKIEIDKDKLVSATEVVTINNAYFSYLRDEKYAGTYVKRLVVSDGHTTAFCRGCKDLIMKNEFKPLTPSHYNCRCVWIIVEMSDEEFSKIKNKMYKKLKNAYNKSVENKEKLFLNKKDIEDIVNEKGSVSPIDILNEIYKK